MRVIRHMLMLSLLAAASAVMVQAIRTNLQPLDDLAATAEGVSGDLAQAAESRPDPAPEPPDLALFSEAFERPLFAEDRRAPENGPVEQDGPEDRSLGVTLLGVLFSRAERVALLVPSDGAGSLRLAEGEEYRGWRLDQIRPNSVLFRREDETVELKLVYKKPGLPSDPVLQVQ